MAEDFGNWWYILSFFAVGIAQQPLLVGVSLPLCAVHIPTSSASTTDILSNDYMNYIFFILCISAILIAESSDTTLQTFMMENKKRVKNGRKKIPILRNGLWKYSRHPNYLGEILFWFGIFGFSLSQSLENWWLIVFPFSMLSMFVFASIPMMDNRSLEKREDYLEYMKETPPLLPFKLLRK